MVDCEVSSSIDAARTVVVALADGDERGEDVVARRVLAVERRVTEPVRQRVDAEGRVVDEQQTRCGGVEEATAPVAPAEAGDRGRQQEAHAEDPATSARSSARCTHSGK